MVELLVVLAIIAILAATAFPLYNLGITHAHCSGCIANMRQLGLAFTFYANDHDGVLPGRAEGAGNDKWPVLLQPYVSSPAIYADPGDPVAVKVAAQGAINNPMVSNTNNNSSFFMNGFNDLGFYSNPSATITMPSLTNASSLMLLGQKVHGNTQYYMDFVEGNQNDILAKTSYFGGSNYTFADGSVQFIRLANYSDTMWLVNQNYVIPPIPSGH